jgi:uncharacterized protein (DUF305 family)
MKLTMIVLAALAAATPLAAQQAMPHQGMDHSRMADASTPYMPAEMAMHDKMMAAKGADAGETWTRKMIEHHRGAIEMSRIALRESRDPAVRRMAQMTITKQQKEIADLNAMLRAKGKRAQ